MNSAAMSILRAAATVGSDCYPETLGLYVIVNTPWGFPILWSIIKTFIDEKTRNSVRVTSQADQLETLREFIHEGDIPEFLGGSCTCKEQGGCMRSDKGPWMQFVRVPPRWVRPVNDFERL